MKKTTTLPKMHFAHEALIRPTNPISVNVIGAGATGSFLVSGLSRLHRALQASGHPGFQVRLIDGDTISAANVARQLFFDAEIGLDKAPTLISRINRAMGLNWKGIPCRYEKATADYLNEVEAASATITISCVDTIQARFEIGEMLSHFHDKFRWHRDQPIYWMDLGNAETTGQVILSTVYDVKQPKSNLYKPVPRLPTVIKEFGKVLKAQRPTEQNTPSCSLVEALEKQDLFINPAVAADGCQLLRDLIRRAMTDVRGVFINLERFRHTALRVE